ncbi:RAMP superfamily CRISPR-associated protein [Actinomadura flavalba]|uniref:RAMP superfamily CRISPR-associated protein n=1 Tax=Actinomadura flavalba TaxID=1120938 RepID=UPI0003808D10|nr:RAMP superfamily CRISPR-associated protein [Actinomadura flavalba]
MKGRPMQHRLRLRGWLRTETPLHVGGVALDPAEALPVAVDGQDHVYVPGTALAGALRAWMRGADPSGPANDKINDMWGFTVDGEPNSGRASRVVVRDAIIAASTRTDADGLPSEPISRNGLPVRHGVGIDRVTGAAASAILYARTVVPPGRYLSFDLDIETTERDLDRDRARLRLLLAALRAEEITLGAAGSKGLGVVTLLPSPLDVHEHDFTGVAGLLAFLGGTPATFADVPGDAGVAALPERRELLTVTLGWRPLSPVMVRASGEGAMVKTLPLTTTSGRDSLVLTLSGSSIKGALRSHGEFIERTVRGDNAPVPEAAAATAQAHSDAFSRQFDELDAVRALFGAPHGKPDKDCFPWGAGALTAHECVSETTIPAETWNVVVDGPLDGAPVPDGKRPLPDAVRDELSGRGLDQADHVAIDRWTGGAADSLLFSVLEPHGVDWEPIRLTVDLTRLGCYRDSAVALLMLVLRDLENRRLPLGGMVNRGFGDVEITSVDISGGGWAAGTSLATALGTPRLVRAWRDYLGEDE